MQDIRNKPESDQLKQTTQKKITRIFRAHSQGHNKPFIITVSSSAADFMLTTPTKSTVSAIAKSPPLRKIRNKQAEATVKKLHVEQTVTNLPPSPATKETTKINQVDTSDDTQTHLLLTFDPICSYFGQAIVMLSPDSQDSNPSFHMVLVHSFPTRDVNASQPSHISCSRPVTKPEPGTSEHSPGRKGSKKRSPA